MKIQFDMLKVLPVMVLLAATIAAQDSPLARIALPNLSGQIVKPFDGLQAKAAVFLFIRTDCPISNRYAPELKRVQKEFASRNVHFYLVYPSKDETTATIQEHIRDYGYQFDVLRDPKHELVKLAGAQVTPEAAVFALGQPGVQIVYRGRIDDRFVAFGKMRPAPTRRDLRLAIEAILRGEKPEFATQPAIGCFISKTDEQ